MLLMQLGSLEDKSEQWNNSILENSVITDRYRNNISSKVLLLSLLSMGFIN